MRQAAGEYLALRRALGYRLAQDGQLLRDCAEHLDAGCWPPFLLSVKSASGVIAGEGHLRRCGTGRATTP